MKKITKLTALALAIGVSMFSIVSLASCQSGDYGAGASAFSSLEENIDGAYFITDEGYETYVRKCAKDVGANEAWVKDVLNGGNGGEWSYCIRPKSWFRCAIVGNKITVSIIENTVYDLTVKENEFKGSSITKDITFTCNGKYLLLNDEGLILEFKKDFYYDYKADRGTTLIAPKDVRIDVDNTISFQWNYRSDYGNVGAAIEVKTASSQEYTTLKKVEHVYMNMLTVEFNRSDFEVGENFVRFYHVGGPTINNDNTVTMVNSSDYTSYRVSVGKDGDIKVAAAFSVRLPA